ncbi:hypothetical protein U8607_04165 [Methylobacterium durans]|uniref:hypothetical protein n=1 Tax=Methylobacterium durans TaxID=2202825 RepID=UPI002AFFEE99|nr:hypothetical protein [Methylobacterium durans]MEA1831272.1 hypothetical protein [Methylobacterium durans]
MDIFEATRDGKRFRAVIVSDAPIFVRYEDILLVAEDYGMAANDVAYLIAHDDFPTPINSNAESALVLRDGIWMRDRVAAFFDWVMNESSLGGHRDDAIASEIAK